MSEREDLIRSIKGHGIPVLDRGHVQLIDVMGSDADICASARLSYGKGTKSASDDRTLIRYLMRHLHTSPLEQAEIQAMVRCPIDVARQWQRHRTFSFNEMSTRYSVAIDEAQETAPDAWRPQSATNKQGSGEGSIHWPDSDYPAGEWRDRSPGEFLSFMETHTQRVAREAYEQRLAFGVAREQARKDLPLSTYTEMVVKNDLHNWMHFLRLRMDSHAQEEIRAYAEVIGRRIVAPLFPLCWEAFEDYVLHSMTLSGPDLSVIGAISVGLTADEALRNVFDNKREREECRAKLRKLGIIRESEGEAMP